MTKLGTKYLLQCKRNYFNNIMPSIDDKNNDDYKKLMNIALEYINNGKIEEFAEFFLESQYNIDLWTAHLILDYANPNKTIKRKALEIIKEYSKTPLDVKLAKAEQNWLKNNNYDYI